MGRNTVSTETYLLMANLGVIRAGSCPLGKESNFESYLKLFLAKKRKRSS
jgi:hypothetical protein